MIKKYIITMLIMLLIIGNVVQAINFNKVDAANNKLLLIMKQEESRYNNNLKNHEILYNQLLNEYIKLKGVLRNEKKGK